MLHLTSQFPFMMRACCYDSFQIQIIQGKAQDKFV